MGSTGIFGMELGIHCQSFKVQSSRSIVYGSMVSDFQKRGLVPDFVESWRAIQDDSGPVARSRPAPPDYSFEGRMNFLSSLVPNCNF